MRRLLEHLGVPQDGRLRKHGARPDLPIAMRTLDLPELEAQQRAWTSVLDDYLLLRRRTRKNHLVRVLNAGGMVATAAGGLAVLVPSLAVVGAPASLAGLGILLSTGSWRLLSLRWKRQATSMVELCRGDAGAN